MLLVFTCTMMIHGDLGPDKFEKVLRCWEYTSPSDQNMRTINNQTEVADQRWQVTHRT